MSGRRPYLRSSTGHSRFSDFDLLDDFQKQVNEFPDSGSKFESLRDKYGLNPTVGTEDLEIGIEYESEGRPTGNSVFADMLEHGDEGEFLAIVNRVTNVSEDQWQQLLFKQSQDLAELVRTPIMSASKRSGIINNDFWKEAHQELVLRTVNRSIFGWPIFSCHSKLYRLWAFWILMLDMSYSAFAVPIILAFDSVNLEVWNWAMILDYITGPCYIIDWFVNFSTSFVATHDYHQESFEVKSGTGVARYYLRHGFMVDTSTVVAFTVQVVFTIIALHTPCCGNTANQIITGFRALRLLRIVQLLQRIVTKYFWNQMDLPFMRGKVEGTIQLLIGFNYILLVLLNFVGCMWLMIARWEGFENTWVNLFSPFVLKYGTDGILTAEQISTSVPGITLYVTSVYWACTTLTTIGYGDITPASISEQIYTMLIQVVAVFVFGTLLTTIANMLASSMKKSHQLVAYREKLSTVERIMKVLSLTVGLRKKIQQYYAKCWSKAVSNDAVVMFNEMPHGLRYNLAWELTIPAFRQISLFEPLEDEILMRFIALMEPFTLPPGFEVFKENTPATHIVLLTSGEVEAYYHYERGETLSAPATLGQIHLLKYVDGDNDYSHHFASWRTMSNCMLWRMGVEEMWLVLRENTEAARDVTQLLFDDTRQRIRMYPHYWVNKYKLPRGCGF